MFHWLKRFLNRQASCRHDYEVIAIQSESTIDEAVDNELHCHYLRRKAVHPNIRYTHNVCLKCKHVVNEIEARRQEIIAERKETMDRQDAAKLIVQEINQSTVLQKRWIRHQYGENKVRVARPITEDLPPVPVYPPEAFFDPATFTSDWGPYQSNVLPPHITKGLSDLYDRSQKENPEIS